MTSKNILLLYNPKSGRFSKEKLDLIFYYFRKNSIKFESFNLLEEPLEANAVKHFTEVLVAGGDGSLNCAINALAYSEIPIGHIPIGTVNLFAIENKTPFNILKSLDEIIFRYKPADLNIGLANDRYFLAMAGIGLDAFIVKAIEEEIHKRKIKDYNNLLKYLKYIYKIINLAGNYQFKDISIKSMRRCVQCGDESEKAATEYTGGQIIVSNISHYGGPFKMFPGNSPLEREFDIRIIKNIGGRAGVLKFILTSLLFNKKHDCDNIYLKSSGLEIESAAPAFNDIIYYHCDGEFMGNLPVKIRKAYGAVRMLVNPSIFEGFQRKGL